MATLNGISFDELPGSPTLSGGRDGPKAQRKFKVAWSDAEAFIGIIFPAAIRTGNGWIFPISLEFPGHPWMSAQTFKLEPFDDNMTPGYDSNVVRSYHWAKITIDYEAPEYDKSDSGRDPNRQGDQILADYSSAYSAEMLKLGISGWFWETRDENDHLVPIKNEEASVAKVIAQIEHTLTWHYVPSPPFRTIARMVGCVNNDEVLFYARQDTLLFTGAELKRSYHSMTGAEAWKVTYKFLQKCVGALTTIGWNHFWRNDTATWDRVRTEGGEYVYARQDFAQLFYADREEEED